MKAAVAERVCLLANHDAVVRDGTDASQVARNPTVWLALAALCVLTPDHVEKLSWSGKPPKMTADGTSYTPVSLEGKTWCQVVCPREHTSNLVSKRNNNLVFNCENKIYYSCILK